MGSSDGKFLMFTVFLIGIVVTVYYFVSVFLIETTFLGILEKTMLVGMIIAILMILAIVLLREKRIMGQMESMRGFGISKKPPSKRTLKDVKNDIMRIYRDMGALKIVFQDNLIDEENYKKQKNELDEKLKKLKDEEKKLKGK